MKNYKILCLTILWPLCLAASEQNDGDLWKPFQFMMGDWVGGGSGNPGGGTGRFSLAPDLNKKVLIRRNHADYPSKSGQSKSAAHDDLMVIYPQGGDGKFRAEYFDSEGHVIHYAVSFSGNKIIFESDAAAPGPRFKLVYEMKSADVLGIEFDMAAPNQDYHPYLSGTVHRQKQD